MSNKLKKTNDTNSSSSIINLKNGKIDISIFIIAAILIITIVIIIYAANSGNKDNTGKSSSNSDTSAKWSQNKEVQKVLDKGGQLTGKHHVEIIVKNYGKIEVELYADDAPISVTNFVKLANSGFYNGLTFHRIISGFMIQGGDPKHDGTGGSDETIKGEFSGNGVENKLKHTRGAISMARSMDNDSASSQFFIMHQTTESLDGQYAVFGYATSGLSIVDEICENTPVEDSNGTVEYDNQPVIECINVID